MISSLKSKDVLWMMHGPAPFVSKLMLVDNHDHEQVAYYRENGFDLIRPFTLDGPDGWRLTFTHYPDEEAVLGDKALNVHGHIQTKLQASTRYLNLSVEWTDYAPVRAGTVVDAGHERQVGQGAWQPAARTMSAKGLDHVSTWTAACFQESPLQPNW